MMARLDGRLLLSDAEFEERVFATEAGLVEFSAGHGGGQLAYQLAFWHEFLPYVRGLLAEEIVEDGELELEERLHVLHWRRQVAAGSALVARVEVEMRRVYGAV